MEINWDIPDLAIFLWLLDPWQVKVIISVILRKCLGIISISYDFLLSWELSWCFNKNKEVAFILYHY